MTGAEFRKWMANNKISAVDLGAYCGCNPQTIRNLWKKDTLPLLYRIAAGAYSYGLPPLSGTSSAPPLGGGRKTSRSKPEKSDERARSKKVPDLSKKNVDDPQDQSEPTVIPAEKPDLWSKIAR
jgi:hypothetical protein